MQRHIEPRDISGAVTLVALARNESRTVRSRVFSPHCPSDLSAPERVSTEAN
jgi:hypothetical protein